ncbi:MAG: hypothetical protein AYP45_10210 [Candidatus Brocadia carolinensis]|uniref:Uncharacterized protein n=1 Tax=Candidatus Brocadia carolinensis TaxID=1004156 RepID=A0A1V4ASW7_9BACT|nr:MAG: hypothetical protein AYP45_10210 [Candidatus Brocadia caroliniensis]
MRNKKIISKNVLNTRKILQKQGYGERKLDMLYMEKQLKMNKTFFRKLANTFNRVKVRPIIINDKEF